MSARAGSVGKRSREPLEPGHCPRAHRRRRPSAARRAGVVCIRRRRGSGSHDTREGLGCIRLATRNSSNNRDRLTCVDTTPSTVRCESITDLVRVTVELVLRVVSRVVGATVRAAKSDDLVTLARRQREILGDVGNRQSDFEDVRPRLRSRRRATRGRRRGVACTRGGRRRGVGRRSGRGSSAKARARGYRWGSARRRRRHDHGTALWSV